MNGFDVYNFHTEPWKGMDLSSSYFEPFLASWDMDTVSVTMIVNCDDE